MGSEPDGGCEMTEFFYGTTVNEALHIAKQGKILSPVMQEKSWLNEIKKTQPDYYRELVGQKSLEDVAAELATTSISPGQEEYINEVTLVDSISLALLQAARKKEPKVVLGFDLNRPKTRIERVPSQLYINCIADVFVTDEALPHANEIFKAYKVYGITKEHFQHIVKKK